MTKIFRLIVALLVLSAALLPTRTFAAEETEGIKFFREALTKDSDALDRLFHQDFYFASPFVQGELELLGMVDGDVFKSAGELSIWQYKNDGTSLSRSIPFHMEQRGNDMLIYFCPDEKNWQKFTAPSLAAAVTDFITTPTPAEVEQIIAETKEVTILEDNEYRCTMLVRPDGDKLADSLRKKSDELPADKGTANDGQMQSVAVDYLDRALRKADIWYMWTIDKRDWHTVAMQYNLSGVIQELARAALDDPNQHWPDEVSQLLETIAFYSEIRTYTIYPNIPDAKKRFVIPKDVVKKAKAVDDMLGTDKK